MDTLIANVRLLDPASGLDAPGALLIRDGRIADLSKSVGRPNGIEGLTAPTPSSALVDD